MMRVPAVLLSLAFCSLCLARAGEGPGFASAPRVSTSGGTARVEFGVSSATDVTVEVVGAEGRVVRHLAAGALGGPKPPPAPLEPGLVQSLVWDRKDDAGRPVTAACRVRVRLGVGFKFDRFVIDPGAGNAAGPILPDLVTCEKNALAVDSRGNIHVLLTYGTAGLAGRTENRLIVLSPQGKYLRSLVPFRASTPARKLRGVDFVSAEPGRLHPRVYERVCTSLLPKFESLPLQTMAITGDDRLVLTSGWRTELYGFGQRSVLVMGADGSIPRSRLNGPVLGEKITGGFAHVGVSPDGKHAYVTGLADGRYYDPVKNPKILHHTVLRVGLEDVDGKPEVFFGKHKSAGAGADLLNDPRGLAVDGKGNVYVSDHMNDRVAVISPQGKLVREIKCVGPTTMVVAPATGTVYVFSLPPSGGTGLVKLGPDGKQAWRLPVGGPPRSRPLQLPSLAIDARGTEPVVYMGSNYNFNKYRLTRIVDRGAKCETSELIPPVKTFGDSVVSVTPDDRLYVRVRTGPSAVTSYLEEGSTGKRTPWWPRYYDRALLGRDGLCYTYRINKPKKGDVRIERSTPARNAVPFASEDKLAEKAVGAFWAGRRSNLFVTFRGAFQYLEYLVQGGGSTRILRYGADGKLAGPAVKGLLGPIGVKTDRAGNIYTADNLKPPGTYWPKGLDGFVSRIEKKGRDEYAETYGAILKFGPEGGSVTPGPAGAGARAMELCGGEKKYAVEGLVDCFVGISPLAPLRQGFRSKCWCLGASFDLGAHDRLFVPDSARFCVHVLDSNLNPITSFGGYDSIDAPQGHANAPGPGISFECPLKVDVSDRAAYVYDAAPCARRTLRLKLTYAAEKSCKIP
jgi:hypothetical protein